MWFDIVPNTIFWLSVAALAYTYLGYPLLLLILSRIRGHKTLTATCNPTITIIITAYNEERDLAAKLNNTLLLDYPKDKLEIIVASDCSSDATDRMLPSNLPTEK
jgi:cellulose synthase/poly-beta-1,6-N-acetylglucosamine synthase-like glycosyltransferase